MATLSMLRFSTPGGAAAALEEVRTLSAIGRLAARDFATMSWEPGRLVPDVQCTDARQPPFVPLGRGFWNLLFSHLFFLPIAATAAGVALRVNCYSLEALGIRDDFLRTSRERLTPGTSALFVLTDDANVDPVIHLLEDLPFTIASTNLSMRQVEALRAAFGVNPESHPTTGPPRRGGATM